MKAPSMKKIPSIVKETPAEVKMDHTTYNPQPSVSIDETVLPEIKKWEIGKEYCLEIKVKMTGINQRDYGHFRGKACGEFRITQIGLDKDNDE